MQRFLEQNKYINWEKQIVLNLINTIFSENMSDLEKADKAYHFVRDEISHSVDGNNDIVTVSSDEVLEYKTGISYSKAILLAALLRSQGIPTGFCFQRIAFMKDCMVGHRMHCYNAIWLEGKWVKVDARGNKSGIFAEFSTEEPCLAFKNRMQLGECYYKGIYSDPDSIALKALRRSKRLEQVVKRLPEGPSEKPIFEV